MENHEINGEQCSPAVQAVSDSINEAIVFEVRRVEFIMKSNELRSFARRFDHWELLLRIMQHRRSTSIGLNEIALHCRFGGMHHNSLSQFLRDQVTAKNLNIEPGNRRDKKVVRPSEKLLADFVRLSSLRGYPTHG